MNPPANKPDSTSNLNDSDVEDIYSQVFPSIKKKRREYDTEDRKVMMKYLLANNRLDHIKSRSMWVEMEHKKILPGRSWQSLKEHFVKKMMPFHLHELSLHDSDLEFIFRKIPSAEVSYDAIVNKKKIHLQSLRLAHEEFIKKISPTQRFSFGMKCASNETDCSETSRNPTSEVNAIEEIFTNEDQEMDTVNETDDNEMSRNPSSVVNEIEEIVLNEDQETNDEKHEDKPIVNLSDSFNDSASSVPFISSPSTNPVEDCRNSPSTNPVDSALPKLSAKCKRAISPGLFDIPSERESTVISEDETASLEMAPQQSDDGDRNICDSSQQTSVNHINKTPLMLKKAAILLERLPKKGTVPTSCYPPATNVKNVSSQTTQTENIESCHFTNNSPKKQRSRRIAFSLDEDLCILKYIIRNNQQHQVGGNLLWQDMEEEKMDILKNRTWQSLKERFRKRILPRLSEYPLDEEEVCKLKGAVSTNRTPHKVPVTRQPPPVSSEDEELALKVPVTQQLLEPPPVSSSDEEFAPRRFWKTPLLVKPKRGGTTKL